MQSGPDWNLDSTPAAGRSGAVRLLLCLTLSLAAALPAPGVRAQESGIQVTGTGEVTVVPDLARLSVEVRREGDDPAALKAELDEVTAAVLALGRELEVAERDITAAAVHVFPRYVRDGDLSRPDGVIASRNIEFTVRALDRLADLINGALERGANGIGGVQLDASNRKELDQQALDLAIDDAVRTARQVARRFGVELGPLAFASTGPKMFNPVMMEAMAVRGAAKDSLAPGELSITQTIQASFAIRE